MRARTCSIEGQDQEHCRKRERNASGDDGHATASTVAGENDSAGQQSDSETPRKDAVCDDEASEAACSLAKIMMSIQSGRPKKSPKLQPASAPAALESAKSSVSGDDENSSGDVTLVKKQRRREKNRASAQQSRQRKKCHLETLEVRVEQLERERAALLSRVDALAAENRRLRALGPDTSISADAGASTSSIKAEEIAGLGLLNQLAQAAQKLSRISTL